MARKGSRREYILEFSTPQRLTVMGRELDVVEFRTPQHPSTGTNRWGGGGGGGGGSPLLSRNIPRESLSASYLRFNAIAGDGDDHVTSRRCAVHPSPAERARGVGDGERRRSAGVSKWRLWWKKGGERVFGCNDIKKRKEKEKGKKSCRWTLVGDYRSRWPQGWC